MTHTKPITVKAKSDPEALLNDLSSSLKRFQSTVRSWTSEAAPGKQSSTVSSVEMRPARLGLGAKAERKVAGSDSVAGNLALKNQLTREFKGRGGSTSSARGSTSSSSISTSASKSHSKPPQKRKETSDEEGGGRASMISNKKKK